MSNYNAHENTPYSAYGEFEGYDVTDNWTSEDWAEYDAAISAEISEWDEANEDFYFDPDAEPPF